jgi:hypothetical protein
MDGGGHAIGASGRASFAGHLNEGQIANEHPAFVGSPMLGEQKSIWWSAVTVRSSME